MSKKEIKIPKQFNERELQIAAILASFGAKKEEMGVIELSIAFGAECWERGREEMKEELSEKLSEQDQSYQDLKDWAESKGLDVATYGA